MNHHTIICMKWGTRYPSDYVNRLYRAVRLYTSSQVRFICFTDDREGICDGVECHDLPPITLPLPERWTGWQKISVWQAPLLDLQGDVLFLDIDLIITGSLDELFTWQPGEFCVIDNWTQPGQKIGNTSVFKFPVGRYTHVYDRLMQQTQRYLQEFRIEQQYISAQIPEQKFWPAEWCVSFKHSCLPPFPLNWVQVPHLPDGAKVVAFHGKPDPEEAMVGQWPAPWYKKLYKHVRPVPWIQEYWQRVG